jgi:hypothetical protein
MRGPRTERSGRAGYFGVLSDAGPAAPPMRGVSRACVTPSSFC